MFKRTLTAILLIPPVVYLIGWSPKWLFLLALVLAVELGLREFFALCRAMGLKVFPWVGYVAGAALCVVQMARENMGYLLVFPLSLVLLLVISTLALRRSIDLNDYLAGASVTVFGILYIGLTLSCLVPIRFSPHSFGSAWMRLIDIEHLRAFDGPQLILFLFLIIWAGDICAYLVGRPFGRTPFFARISPRKTWEGALAGLAGSLLAAWAFARWFWKAADPTALVLMTGWIAVAGQAGDLVESAIKRGASQKDSGTLLPGHGGFLDRIDSLLFAAPALWLAMLVVDIVRMNR